MNYLKRLVSAVAIVVFIAVSIPQVTQWRKAIRTLATPAGDQGAGAVGSQNVSAQQTNDHYPPPRVLPPEGSASAWTSPAEPAPGTNDAGPVTAPRTNSAMFTRWAMVVVLFAITITAAVGVGIIAFFVTRMLRRRAEPYVIYRNDMRAYLREAERIRDEQAVLCNRVMRAGPGRPNVDRNRRFG